LRLPSLVTPIGSCQTTGAGSLLARQHTTATSGFNKPALTEEELFSAFLWFLRNIITCSNCSKAVALS
jgi:hypothetical protein